MKYFKVHLGYDKEIPITESELPKVLYAQITGKTVILENYTLAGKLISLIEPDYVRAMGWNEGYNPNSEDWALINRDCIEYKGYIAKAKDQVQLHMRSGQEQLIGEGKLQLT